MNQSSEQLRNELQDLKREVAALREELQAVRAQAQSSANAAIDASGRQLHLRCASLSVESEDGRFAVRLSVDADGGALHLTDENAGETRERAALLLTEGGATLALCGRDGVPRLVAQSRSEGGGVSMVNENRDLAAEMWGAGEASWLGLYHEGRPAVLGVAVAGGGTLETFDADGELSDAVPPAREEVFPPPATSDAPAI